MRPPPIKVCPACFHALPAASHHCSHCHSIQPCAVRRDDAKRAAEAARLDRSQPENKE